MVQEKFSQFYRILKIIESLIAQESGFSVVECDYLSIIIVDSAKTRIDLRHEMVMKAMYFERCEI